MPRRKTTTAYAAGMDATPPAEESAVAELDYEQARDALLEIVSRLEAGDLSLEESLRLWERGEELAAQCSRWLEGAARRLDASDVAADAADEATEPPSD